MLAKIRDNGRTQVKYCSFYSTQANILSERGAVFDDFTTFEDTCVDIVFDTKILVCGTTYGGNPCGCSVCDNSSSTDMDCSQYNSDAWSYDPPHDDSHNNTGGFTRDLHFQNLHHSLSPFTPAFGILPKNYNNVYTSLLSSQDDVVNNRSYNDDIDSKNNDNTGIL